jgi:TonB family protein
MKKIFLLSFILLLSDIIIAQTNKYSDGTLIGDTVFLNKLDFHERFYFFYKNEFETSKNHQERIFNKIYALSLNKEDFYIRYNADEMILEISFKNTNNNFFLGDKHIILSDIKIYNISGDSAKKIKFNSNLKIQTTFKLKNENLKGYYNIEDERKFITEKKVSSINNYSNNSTSYEDSEVLSVVEQMPEFIGGEKDMYKFITNNIVYPPYAKHNQKQGRVYIQFVVGLNGELTNFEVVRGVGYGLDEEALRVSKLMPNWKVGKQDGRAVKVKCVIPVEFNL